MGKRVEKPVPAAVAQATADLEPARRIRFRFHLDQGDPPAVALEKARAMPLPRKRFVRAVDPHG